MRYEDNGDAVNNFVVIKVPSSKGSIDAYGSQEAFLQEIQSFGLLGKQAYTGAVLQRTALPTLRSLMLDSVCCSTPVALSVKPARKVKTKWRPVHLSRACSSSNRSSSSNKSKRLRCISSGF